MKVYFSVLRYQLITNESVNIGVLFHNSDTDERRLELIAKWERVKNFDDEVEIKFLKILVMGMRDEIENNIFNQQSHFDIIKYTKRFYNELRFSPIYEDNIKDFEVFIDITKKNMLRYDFDKKDRPKKEEQIKFIRNLMKNKEVDFITRPIEGEHSEKITYDYIIDNYAFKLFSFENKNLNKVINNAKLWAYNANEMREKYNTIFVYDVELESDEFKTILSILGGSARVMKYDESVEFILNLNSKKIINL